MLLELRILVWLVIAWLALTLAALSVSYGAGPVVAFGMARRLARWRRARRRCDLAGGAVVV